MSPRFVSKLRKNIFIGVMLVLSAATARSDPRCEALSASAVPERWQPSRLQAQLDALVASRRVKGLVLGWVTPHGRCVLAAGESGEAARPRLDGDSLFEIASITKGFTGALLAEAVRRGEIKLDDTLGTSFGDALPAPLQGSAGLAALTWRQLTTHRSGIPRVPMSQMAFWAAMLKDPANPYKHYAIDDYWAHLRGLDLKPGAQHEYAYSNSGAALLGMLLAAKAGLPLETGYAVLLQERLLQPLGLSDTHLVVPESARLRVAQGHDAKGQPTPAWSLNFWAPAGGLHSSANDLLKLVDASLQRREPLASAQQQLEPLGKVGGIAHNWHISRTVRVDANGVEQRRSLVWHNGGTDGARSMVGVDVEQGFGVVVLANTGMSDVPDELALHLWDGSKPAPSTQAHEGWSFLQKALAAVLGITGLSLAVKAWATSESARNTPAPTVGRRKRWLPTPFRSKVEVALNLLSAFAACLLIFKFLPPLALAGMPVSTLWLSLLALLGLGAAWAGRGLPLSHLQGWKSWLGAVWSLAFVLLFLWWALA
jgi:serine-type D-Ala-D-Ala carboxypeptidase/endopeptidase